MHIIVMANNVECHMSFPGMKGPIEEIYIISDEPWNMVQSHLTAEQIEELREKNGQKIGGFGLYFDQIKNHEAQ